MSRGLHTLVSPNLSGAAAPPVCWRCALAHAHPTTGARAADRSSRRLQPPQSATISDRRCWCRTTAPLGSVGHPVSRLAAGARNPGPDHGPGRRGGHAQSGPALDPRDLRVDRAQRRGGAGQDRLYRHRRGLTDPIVIVEVLSPSTMDRDRGVNPDRRGRKRSEPLSPYFVLVG